MRTQIVSELLPLIQQVSNTDNIIQDVLAWLTLNTIKSERLQGIQLCQQNLSSVWRKKAMSELMRPATPASSRLTVWTSCFREVLERSVRHTVDPPTSMIAKLSQRVTEFSSSFAFSPLELEELRLRMDRLAESMVSAVSETELPSDRTFLDGELQRDVNEEDETLLSIPGPRMDEEKMMEREVEEEDEEEEDAQAAAAATGFDATLVQTREKESEQERHKETESEVAVDRLGVDLPPAVVSWNLSELPSLLSDALSPAFGRMSSLTVSDSPTVLPFPSKLFVTSNHTRAFSRLDSGLLKDVVTILHVGVGSDSVVSVIVTLAEAETLRRVFHVPPVTPVLPPVALDVMSLGYLDTSDVVHEDPHVADIRLCARFFNCTLWFTPKEVQRLVVVLFGSSSADRTSFFTECLNRRHRLLQAWQGTSVEQVRRILRVVVHRYFDSLRVIHSSDHHVD